MVRCVLILMILMASLGGNQSAAADELLISELASAPLSQSATEIVAWSASHDSIDMLLGNSAGDIFQLWSVEQGRELTLRRTFGLGARSKIVGMESDESGAFVSVLWIEDLTHIWLTRIYREGDVKDALLHVYSDPSRHVIYASMKSDADGEALMVCRYHPPPHGPRGRTPPPVTEVEMLTRQDERRWSRRWLEQLQVDPAGDQPFLVAGPDDQPLILLQQMVAMETSVGRLLRLARVTTDGIKDWRVLAGPTEGMIDYAAVSAGAPPTIASLTIPEIDGPFTLRVHDGARLVADEEFLSLDASRITVARQADITVVGLVTREFDEETRELSRHIRISAYGERGQSLALRLVPPDLPVRDLLIVSDPHSPQGFLLLALSTNRLSMYSLQLVGGG